MKICIDDLSEPDSDYWFVKTWMFAMKVTEGKYFLQKCLMKYRYTDDIDGLVFCKYGNTGPTSNYRYDAIPDVREF